MKLLAAKSAMCCQEGACAAQLPGDAEVVRAHLRIERKARLAAPALPSSFAADVAEITGARVLAEHVLLQGCFV